MAVTNRKISTIFNHLGEQVSVRNETGQKKTVTEKLL